MDNLPLVVDLKFLVDFFDNPVEKLDSLNPLLFPLNRGPDHDHDHDRGHDHDYGHGLELFSGLP